jgi:hypothetical protein
MERKNLDRRTFLKLSGALIGSFAIGSCASNKKLLEKIEGPIDIIKHETTSEGYFPVLNGRCEETGIFLRGEEYRKITNDLPFGKSAEVPNQKGLYVLAGQGRLRGALNNLFEGSYMPAYDSKINLVEELGVSERKVRELCGASNYNGRFINIPGTSLLTRCYLFEKPTPRHIEQTSSEGGQSNGPSGPDGSGGGGSSGGTGGGGQGAGGGNSSGSR